MVTEKPLNLTQSQVSVDFRLGTPLKGSVFEPGSAENTDLTLQFSWQVKKTPSKTHSLL